MKPARHQPVRALRLPRWLVAASAGLALLGVVPAAGAATQLYPDLKTLPPRDLRFDWTDVSPDGGGPAHHVLRFTNTVWNDGQGRLVVHGAIDPATHAGTAYQRVSDSAGGSVDYRVGRFYYHPAHHHYHFDNWGRYELWTKGAYAAWLAGGRTGPLKSIEGTKTTSCVLDEEFVSELAPTAAFGQFPFAGCSPSGDRALLEGLSPGWGDTYDYYRFEQWIDLGSGSLADGDYVLRSVTDPDNKIYESPDRANSSRESQQVNEATTPFSVQGGELVDTSPPTGTVQINDVDRHTGSPRVTLRVLGRDDVSGVARLRVSNDGSSWAEYRYDRGSDGSDRQSLAWDLSDPRYGGVPGGGVKRVHVEFQDGTGRWGRPASDSITLLRCGAGTGAASRYATAVGGDRPVSEWRLDETCGSVAADASQVNWGRYAGSPGLGARGLLAAEPGDTAVSFDGRRQWVQVPDSASLHLTGALTLEAWIRPSRLPGPGGFASVLTKPESYSLQLNGSRLEFTLIQHGARRRLLAPRGAIHAERTAHVVGTYDGRYQRLYVGGRLVAARRQDAGAGVNSNPLFLAAWSPDRELYAGTIDEVAVYDRALSDAAVRAHHTAGSPPPAVVAPSNLRARARSRSRIELTWADDASHESGLLLERSTDRRFRHVRVRRLRAHLTRYASARLRRGTLYWYRIRAVRGRQASAWSRAARARTY